MTRDDMEIVSTLRSALADKVGQERFDLWFGAGTRLNYDGRALRIGAPNDFFLEWIRSNFRRHIEMACCDVLGNCPAIEFHLDVAPAQGDSDPMQAVPIERTANDAQPGPRLAVMTASTIASSAGQRPETSFGVPGTSPNHCAFSKPRCPHTWPRL